MSFPNYDAFQGQQTSEDPAGAGASVAQPQQPPMPMNQQVGGEASFTAGNPSTAGTQVGEASGTDMKTTLW